MGAQPGTFRVDRPYLLIGRTFAEYCRMFSLRPSRLANRSILDCPGGPGSFAATVAQLGACVMAVDPAYGPPTDRLASTCSAAIDRTVAQLREKTELFVLDEYRPPGASDAVAVGTRGRYLRAAAHRFLADYDHHPGRYIPAALPRLPFAANTFDLVLSGNFLFLYDDRHTLSFHRDAMRELVRVAREEVRVFPLSSLDRERSTYVRPVVENLRGADLSVEYTGVSYEFQPGASEMLVVTDVGGFTGRESGVRG